MITWPLSRVHFQTYKNSLELFSNAAAKLKAQKNTTDLGMDFRIGTILIFPRYIKRYSKMESVWELQMTKHREIQIVTILKSLS